MPEIEEELTLDVAPGNILMQTQVNGDRITINGLHFTAGQAATLAWLLNNEVASLEITIKEKP